MTFTAEQHRFNWIHCYGEAMRLALANELTGGRPAQVSDIRHFMEQELAWWLALLGREAELRGWLAHKRGRGCYWSPRFSHDFYYLYDLEAELWGANLGQFMDSAAEQPVALEPFRLVLLFYLTERALKLLLAHLGFLQYEQNNLSHARIRQAAYSHLFEQSRLARWLPFPFNLAALSKRLVHGQEDYARHAAYGLDPGHFRLVGKSHYTQVLESALCQAVGWQRERHARQGFPPAQGSIRAFFFDPLWRYSESYRYRLPLAGDALRQNPFLWNLNLRWLGSALLELVELWLYTLSAQRLRDAWQTYAAQSRSPALAAIQQPRWQAIQAAGPQRVVT